MTGEFAETLTAKSARKRKGAQRGKLLRVSLRAFAAFAVKLVLHFESCLDINISTAKVTATFNFPA